MQAKKFLYRPIPAHTHTHTHSQQNLRKKKQINREKKSESIYNQKISSQSHGKLDINLTTKSKQSRTLVYNATKE